MKVATIPPLRVTPALRGDAESVLREGESLSAFLEESLRLSITRRRVQSAFLARGMNSRNDARSANDYVSADEVLSDLKAMLKQAKGKAKAGT